MSLPRFQFFVEFLEVGVGVADGLEVEDGLLPFFKDDFHLPGGVDLAGGGEVVELLFELVFFVEEFGLFLEKGADFYFGFFFVFFMLGVVSLAGGEDGDDGEEEGVFHGEEQSMFCQRLPPFWTCVFIN